MYSLLGTGSTDWNGLSQLEISRQVTGIKYWKEVPSTRELDLQRQGDVMIIRSTCHRSSFKREKANSTVAF